MNIFVLLNYTGINVKLHDNKNIRHRQPKRRRHQKHDLDKNVFVVFSVVGRFAGTLGFQSH